MWVEFPVSMWIFTVHILRHMCVSPLMVVTDASLLSNAAKPCTHYGMRAARIKECRAQCLIDIDSDNWQCPTYMLFWGGDQHHLVIGLISWAVPSNMSRLAALVIAPMHFLFSACAIFCHVDLTVTIVAYNPSVRARPEGSPNIASVYLPSHDNGFLLFLIVSHHSLSLGRKLFHSQSPSWTKPREAVKHVLAAQIWTHTSSHIQVAVTQPAKPGAVTLPKTHPQFHSTEVV